MSSNPAKRFTPRFKFQIVLESLKGEKAVGQLARASYSETGCKGNVHMESFNGRFKQENRDLF